MTESVFSYAARSITLEEATPDLIAQWQDLVQRSIEGNCFLAPWFVRPAARWLDPGVRIRLLLVEAIRSDHRAALTGLIAFHRIGPSLSLPWPHLAAYRPVHAYSSGALIDAAHADGTIRCLLNGLADVDPRCGALRLSDFRCDGPLGALARHSIQTFGVRWYATHAGARAALRASPQQDSGESATATFARTSGEDSTATEPGPIQKPLRRHMRRLETSAGPVSLRLLRDRQVDAEAIERHLALENSGWKRADQGALLARPEHAAFFREVVRGAADAGGLLFCELLAGDSVIASTSNFIAGREAFAFKLGWDAALAPFSPGLLVDEELRRHASTALATQRTLDGCAGPGSHLERIWSGRIEVADGYLAWGRREQAMLGAIESLRRVRRWIRHRS